MTTAGRAAVLTAVGLSDTLLAKDVQLSATAQSVGIGTTALASVVKTLTSVVGSVRPAGAGHALHVVVTDSSADTYDVRAFSLRLSDDTALLVYSQAGVIASKASPSALLLAFDLTIDADLAATITFGDTDFVLPAASASAPGIIETATDAESIAGLDALRAVTPAGLQAVFGERQVCYLPVPLTSWMPLSSPGWVREIDSMAVYGHLTVGMLADVPIPEGMIVDGFRFGVRGNALDTCISVAAYHSREMDGISDPPADGWLNSIYSTSDLIPLVGGELDMLDALLPGGEYGPVGKGSSIRILVISRSPGAGAFGNFFLYKAQIIGSVPLVAGTSLP